MEEMILNLDEYGIEVRFNTSKAGLVSGISFCRGGFSVKGSSLGSKYSYIALSRRLPSIAEITIDTKRSIDSRHRSVRTR